LGRYLSFLSWHPFCQKKSTIIGRVDRMFMLLHPSFHQKNLKLIVKILLENNYPLNFIFKTISNRIRQSRTLIIKHRMIKKFHISMIKLLILGLSFHILTVIWKNLRRLGVSDMRVAYYRVNKLRNIFKAHKDPFLNLYKKNVIYKLNCNNCEATYVG